MTTGNFYYISKIAKTFPWLVHSIMTEESYAPITLSGIVHQEGSAVTTELPVAFTFHLPYKTTSGDNTTLSIAAGPHTGVNIILGLPFLEAVGMVVDFSDNVADCRNLECPPFPLSKKRTQVHVPAVATTHANFSGDLEQFDEIIEELERNIASVYAQGVAPPSPRRKVRFNSTEPVDAGLTSTDKGVPMLPGDFLPADALRGDDAVAHDLEAGGSLISDDTE